MKTDCQTTAKKSSVWIWKKVTETYNFALPTGGQERTEIFKGRLWMFEIHKIGNLLNLSYIHAHTHTHTHTHRHSLLECQFYWFYWYSCTDRPVVHTSIQDLYWNYWNQYKRCEISPHFLSDSQNIQVSKKLHKLVQKERNLYLNKKLCEENGSSPPQRPDPLLSYDSLQELLEYTKKETTRHD